ncbi:50S ribosomal protein L14e [Candidatus Woesearchaeota archaeon]|nr:50S ribosomal protein L14e [Candidatus Woesearchaeota archaeon]
MALFEVGRVCMKIAGRDAGKHCVIVETVDDRFVVVDGQTRRRKVNILHLEPLGQTLSLGAKASHEQVVKAFSGLGITVGTSKPRATPARVLQQRKGTQKSAAEEKAPIKEAKPAAKKAAPKKKE